VLQDAYPEPGIWRSFYYNVSFETTIFKERFNETRPVPKAVLTVIAACLAWICLSDANLVRPAHATSAQNAVRIIGFDQGVQLSVSLDSIGVNKGVVPVQQK
jgi:hypothetical protein